MSADPDQEYFCDGLAEELINALSQISDLRVVARTSAFSFKGQTLDVREIGKRLGVGTVLEGSIRKAGNRLRIMAQLVDVSDGYHLWSEKFDREMTDIFEVQDEISETIVDRLKPRILKGEKEKLVQRQTVDLEAYNLYLKGRYFAYRFTEEGLYRGKEYYERAIEKVPDYALAYVGLADVYLNLPIYTNFPPDEAYAMTRESVLKALEINDDLGEAHCVLAHMKVLYEWDWDGAEREHRRALEINPGYAWAHHRYSIYLSIMARFDEAINESKIAHELDPLSPPILRQLGMTLHYSGRHGEAIEVLKKGLELDSGLPFLHMFLGGVYLSMSLFEEALTEVAMDRRISGHWNPLIESYIGAVYAAMGKSSEANQILDEMIERSKEESVSPVTIAILHIALGQIDKGFEWLERAYVQHDMLLVWLKIAPPFEVVRSDPRYIALLKKIGLDK
jgi:TolB-like protein